MLVQALVAHAPVQALDKTVLLRLVGEDVVPLDRMLLLPVQNRVRGRLDGVVRDDHQRLAPARDDPVQLARDRLAGQ